MFSLYLCRGPEQLYGVGMPFVVVPSVPTGAAGLPLSSLQVVCTRLLGYHRVSAVAALADLGDIPQQLVTCWVYVLSSSIACGCQGQVSTEGLPEVGAGEAPQYCSRAVVFTRVCWG